MGSMGTGTNVSVLSVSNCVMGLGWWEGKGVKKSVEGRGCERGRK